MTGARDLFSSAPAANAVPADDDALFLHASCVAENGRAVLIRGASGRGKSSLALQMMGYGADLVADDQTIVRRKGAALYVRAPDTTRGLIEARGVGILKASPVGEAQLHLVVDLDGREEDRLPHPRETRILGCVVPLLLGVDAAYFAAAILQFLRHGRNA
ncbi:HPr kinase/phosphatase C-terminal domain-containing protein [Shimia sp. R11_0]|uniref:HPr kinase/phosphorylase n=1 Tax=Shimia sp. R11_0 TaxID=2821096 RepID=UPI001ADB81BF|nr:HPr kinase/phosphatase C-terminal domain-containing protein [Shimia sp. R11_0]MBO9478528.1 HPr kinase/phosphatase C-terminal domain-containing protein [Shimia sp. R11_0]